MGKNNKEKYRAGMSVFLALLVSTVQLQTAVIPAWASEPVPAGEAVCESEPAAAEDTISGSEETAAEAEDIAVSENLTGEEEAVSEPETAEEPAGDAENIEGLSYNEAGGYYEIPDVTAFKAFVEYLNYNVGDGSGKIFKLTGDIIYTYGDSDTYNNFTPIGSNGEAFKGTLDGQGHVISGIRIYKKTGTDVGLFRWIQDCTVKNIVLSDARITGKEYVGGIAGEINGGAVVQNCLVLSSDIICTNTSSNYRDKGVIAGEESGTNDLACNLYRDCTVDGKNYSVGAYSTDQTWACSGHIITLPEGVSASSGITLSHNGITYHGSYENTVTLTCDDLPSGKIPVFTVKKTEDQSLVAETTGTFKMPKADVSVSVEIKDVYSLTLPDGVSAAGTSFTIGDVTYYPKGTSVSLSYTGLSEGYAAVYSINGTPITGNTFNISADTAVSVAANDVWGIAGGADGSEKHPWVIKTRAGLDLLSNKVNGTGGYIKNENSYSNRYFRLGADISYSHTTDWNDNTSTENNYRPIRNGINGFAGTFDGQGHTISGIRIYRGGSDIDDVCYLGLFGKVDSYGTVKNVTVSDSRITGWQDVGGIAGRNEGGTVQNCHAADKVAIYAVSDYSSDHGGIVGYNDGGTIRGCTSSAVLTYAEGLAHCVRIGGIAGQGHDGFIINCLAVKATVSGNNAEGYKSNPGAIAGYISHGDEDALNHNYYCGCTVTDNDNTATSNIGCGYYNYGSWSDGYGDATYNDGAVPGCLITCGKGVSSNALTIGAYDVALKNTEVTLSRCDAPAGYVFGGYHVTVDGTDPVQEVDVNDGKFTLAYDKVTAAALWTVIPADAPAITKQPEDLNLTYGYTTGNTLTVSAGAEDGHTITYQWYSCEDTGRANPREITGATSESYSVPAGKNAGSYYYYCAVTATRTDNKETATASSNAAKVSISKAAHENETASVKKKSGQSGSVELGSLVEAGAVLELGAITDEALILNGTPSLSGNVLEYAFKADAAEGKTANVTVHAKNADNYQDYDIVITLTVFDCPHEHTEIRNARTATCTEQGYTGDTWCTDCNNKIAQGKTIPIDPDNHDFDFDHGVVTRKATLLRKGETTYTCKRCGKTMTRDDIPCPEEEGRDLDDLREDTETLSGNAAPKVEKKELEDGSRQETVIIGGEELSKTITDPDGKETVESKMWIGGLAASYTYTGSAIKPSFRVYDGTRKLKEKTDYTVKYSKNKEAGTAFITLKFRGNYSDTKEETAEFTIAPAVLGVDIIAHETAAGVKKDAQKPVPVLTWAKTGKRVSGKYFDISYDPAAVKEEGTYTATITPKNAGGNFAGSTTALIKIAEKSRLLSNAKVTFDKKSYAYTGNAVIPGYKVTVGNVSLTENVDYRRVSLTNNTDPGTATVIFEAVSGNAAGYVGCKTATFKIGGKKQLKEAGAGSSFTYSFSESVPFAKGGAKPAVVIKDNGITLKEGEDYTVSYAKNRAVTNGSATAEIKVKGKGNYKNTVTLNFAITKQSLKASGICITSSDQFVTKARLKKPSITVIDADGKKLSAGTDYTISDMDTSDPANTDESGVVHIMLTGKNNYRDDESVKTSFRYMKASSDLAKTKALIIKDQTYTGGAVRLGADDLKEILYTGSKSSSAYLVYGKDFVVTGYSDNVKTGTAKAVLSGRGSYAGTKTLTFKIVRKKVDYKGALTGEGWK